MTDKNILKWQKILTFITYSLCLFILLYMMTIPLHYIAIILLSIPLLITCINQSTLLKMAKKRVRE